MTDALELTQADIEQMRAADDEEAAEEEEAAPDAPAEAAPDDTPAPEPVAVDPDKIEKAAKAYFTAIAKAFGKEADQLQPCVLCGEQLPGFMPPTPPFKEAPDLAICPNCDGWGQVKTPSKDPNHKVEQCKYPGCLGNGYVPKAIDVQPFPYQVQISQAPAPDPYPGYGLAFVPVPNGAPDPHGRPAGHPHWGMPRDYSGAAA